MKLPPDGYLFYDHGGPPATHVLCEKYLGDREIRKAFGYVFVPVGLAKQLGPADATVEIHGNTYPAWTLNQVPDVQ